MVSGRGGGRSQKSVQNYKTGEVYGSPSTPPPLFERARWTRDTARAVIETHERLGCGCGPPSKSKLDARKRAMSEVEITVKRNGPYVISGPVVLKDADGAPIRPSRSSPCAVVGHRQRSRSATAPTPRSAFKPPNRPCPPPRSEVECAPITPLGLGLLGPSDRDVLSRDRVEDGERHGETFPTGRSCQER